MQFYRIEVAEQRRLMGVMERHSRESGFLTNCGESQRGMTFPYSITAGVEKGTKNRCVFLLHALTSMMLIEIDIDIYGHLNMLVCAYTAAVMIRKGLQMMMIT